MDGIWKLIVFVLAGVGAILALNIFGVSTHTETTNEDGSTKREMNLTCIALIIANAFSIVINDDFSRSDFIGIIGIGIGDVIVNLILLYVFYGILTIINIDAGDIAARKNKAVWGVIGLTAIAVLMII